MTNLHLGRYRAEPTAVTRRAEPSLLDPTTGTHTKNEAKRGEAQGILPDSSTTRNEEGEEKKRRFLGEGLRGGGRVSGLSLDQKGSLGGRQASGRGVRWSRSEG